MSTQSPTPVVIVRPDRPVFDIAYYALQIGEYFLAAWILMLVASSFDYSISYWHTLGAFVALRMIFSNDSGYSLWTKSH